MTKNITRFKPDLQRLIQDGQLLHLAMRYEVHSEQFAAALRKQLGKDEAQELIKSLPTFSVGYERWYSESLVVLRQLLPDRVGDFVGLYEKPKGRKEVQYGNYVIQDYLQGLRVTLRGEEKVGPGAAICQFEQQLAILKAAEARFESSLFEMRQ